MNDYSNKNLLSVVDGHQRAYRFGIMSAVKPDMSAFITSRDVLRDPPAREVVLRSVYGTASSTFLLPSTSPPW